jgi:hypothetical protein
VQAQTHLAWVTVNPVLLLLLPLKLRCLQQGNCAGPTDPADWLVQ